MNTSEEAALAWLVGGLVATIGVQVVTHGEHSVTAGLRKHPVAFGVVTALFVAHIYEPAGFEKIDPFRAFGKLVSGRVHK